MAAMTTLQDRWGGSIKAALRRIARARNVRLQPEDLDELVVDAVLVLQEVAGAWSPEGLALLAREGSLAGERYRQVEDLQVALQSVASERDRRVFLEVAVQEASGDPSPANTVAHMFGLRPAAVRQIKCRVRRRLLGYASDASDGPDDGLAGLALVA